MKPSFDMRNNARRFASIGSKRCLGIAGSETDRAPACSRRREPMRDLPGANLFPSNLIGDMHRAFDAVCAKLRLAPQSDKATAVVITKIVELANAGRR
jgi:hypothetical protein